jgi:mediator of RNA polymerase II transcription subunit 30
MANEKKSKVYDQLRMIKMMFKRLRLIYEKCNENCQLQGMEYTHIESLIPLKEEWDMKSDEKKSSEAYRLACEESKEVMEVGEMRAPYELARCIEDQSENEIFLFFSKLY